MSRLSPGWTASTALLVLASLARAQSPMRFIDPNETTKTSAAVVVSGGSALVLTKQIQPIDAQGKTIGTGDADRQAEALLDELAEILKRSQSGLDSLVRINVYAANDASLASFKGVLARRLASKTRPALTHVITAQPREGVLLSLDAAAVTMISGPKRTTEAAVLPVGTRIHVSGQARPGKDLAVAARETLEELGETLKFLGLDSSDVVHVKVFMQPITQAKVVEAEIGRWFGDRGAAPHALVDWKSSATVPIEIELVVIGKPVEHRESIDYLTPPILKASPVYSRVARVNEGDLLFTSTLVGDGGKSGKDQVESIYQNLGLLLKKAGGGFGSLAKATYYVSDDETSKALNDIRPMFYDPKRPPAASKAVVTGVGIAGKTIGIDLIGSGKARD